MGKFDIAKETSELVDNMKETAGEAIRGPIGIFSNPLRFLFYASLLGVSQLLVFQVINGAINRAMEKP